MTLKQITDNLDSDRLARDILYASTPKDLIARARKKNEVKDAKAYLKDNNVNIEFVLIAARKHLNTPPANISYSLGKIVAYLEVLSSFPAASVKKLFTEILVELNPDNLLRQATLLLFQNMPETVTAKAASPVKITETKTGILEENPNIGTGHQYLKPIKTNFPTFSLSPN